MFLSPSCGKNTKGTPQEKKAYVKALSVEVEGPENYSRP